MDKKQLEKNALDLAYHKQLNYLNAVLVVGTLGILSFIGTFIWNRTYFKQGLILTIVIILICFMIHKKVDRNTKEISKRIRKL